MAHYVREFVQDVLLFVYSLTFLALTVAMDKGNGWIVFWLVMVGFAYWMAGRDARSAAREWERANGR